VYVVVCFPLEISLIVSKHVLHTHEKKQEPDVNVGVYGKLMYMHPTMFRQLGEARQNRRLTGTWGAIECDLWSLSVVLFTMVVGGPPWEYPVAERDARYRMIAVSGRLDSLLERWNIDSLSKDCVRFLQRCFHPDPTVRYRTWCSICSSALCSSAKREIRIS